MRFVSDFLAAQRSLNARSDAGHHHTSRSSAIYRPHIAYRLRKLLDAAVFDQMRRVVGFGRYSLLNLFNLLLLRYVYLCVHFLPPIVAQDWLT